jgi:hypothetical protein
MQTLSPNPYIGNPALGLRSLAGYRQTKFAILYSTGFTPECGNGTAEIRVTR